ncbi:hypothetical protein DGMP_16590 [Desulfomarina profundi]|uniref:Uncharacterized protein n=1 Tax=Desulfomarina profundi TaxID=2772557 RepID=A0A8D5JRE4_9BACT|nr:hypothetical protein [Desulfomarina profundi]BCL60966.1 hypothetical protein DGMP_16590 [Desulfomarina profundi]
MSSFIFTLTNRSLILFFMLFMVLFTCRNTKAEILIDGTYISASGKQIVLELNISSRRPVNLIVEQFLDPGNFILTTSPGAKKRTSGKIKWLFRNISDRRLSISIRLRSPLKGTISAIIRYRDPDSGQFIESQVIP